MADFQNLHKVNLKFNHIDHGVMFPFFGCLKVLLPKHKVSQPKHAFGATESDRSAIIMLRRMVTEINVALQHLSTNSVQETG